jgi:protein-S-isoprenylcysteine O-methyltransferase Ste14
VGFLGVMVFCALDYRSGWPQVPPVVSLLGNVLVALGLFIDLLVFRENTFGASNIRVEQGQTVVSTGPYAIMRHPMYAGVLVMAVGVPLALGSWWGVLLIGLLMSVLVWRILDEERVLKTELPGYAEYTQRVRYRLVPHVW